MAGELDMGKWKGLFEWSMKYQDGTSPANMPTEELAPEKKAWLEQALQEYMKDFADRMKEITSALNTDSSSSQPAESAVATAASSDNSKELTLAEKEALCDELMDIVESVDCARDLHKIGGLPTLLSLMASSHPPLRWRAAEITATCMANNPPVQRWFMEGGALPHLLGLLSDSNVVVQTKAVLAVSALVRHYDPGLEAFRLAGGLQKLLALLGCATDSVPSAAAREGVVADEQQQQQRRLKRKVLALLQYLLMKHPADGLAAAEYGVVSPLKALLADTDTDMRQAALSVLVEVCKQPQGWELVRQQHQGLVQQLQQLLSQHQLLSAEDQEAEQEEGQLLQQSLSLLQASHARSESDTLSGLKDHIDLDPYQDGGERAEKTVTIRQPQQQQEDQPTNSLSLMAVPKPELR